MAIAFHLIAAFALLTLTICRHHKGLSTLTSRTIAYIGFFGAFGCTFSNLKWLAVLLFHAQWHQEDANPLPFVVFALAVAFTLIFWIARITDDVTLEARLLRLAQNASFLYLSMTFSYAITRLVAGGTLIITL